MPRKQAKTYETEKKVWAKRLREAMEGMTQQELASKIGVKRQTISNYINGQSDPDAPTLVKISMTLNVSADYLLGLKAAKNPFEGLHPIVKKHPGFFDFLLAAEEEAKKNNEEFGLLRSIIEYVLFEKSEKQIIYGNHGDVSIVENEEAVIEDGNSDMGIYIKLDDVFRYNQLKEIEAELDYFRDFIEKHE